MDVPHRLSPSSISFSFRCGEASLARRPGCPPPPRGAPPRALNPLPIAFRSFSPLQYNEGGIPPYNPQQLQYASQFQQAALGVFDELPAPQQRAPVSSGFYSSACFWHCTSEDDSFWGVRGRAARARTVESRVRDLL